MEVVQVPSYDIIGWIGKIVSIFFGNFPELVEKFLSLSVILAIPVCLMLMVGIVVSVERLKVIRRKEKDIYNPKVEVAYDDSARGDSGLSLRWKTITEHIESENQNDWKQAIMEADIILGEILEKMGYQGDGIGEKLRRVEKADFQTLGEAWEAHKIRNIIAHEGASYELNKYEARRVIGLYKQVFEEFFYI